MLHKVLRSLLSEVTSRKWFSLMTDVTRDVSNRELLVYVYDQFQIAMLFTKTWLVCFS